MVDFNEGGYMVGIKNNGEAARLQEKHEEQNMIDYDYWEEIEFEDLEDDFKADFDEEYGCLEIDNISIYASSALKEYDRKEYKKRLYEWCENQVDGIFIKCDDNGGLLRKI